MTLIFHSYLRRLFEEATPCRRRGGAPRRQDARTQRKQENNRGSGRRRSSATIWSFERAKLTENVLHYLTPDAIKSSFPSFSFSSYAFLRVLASLRATLSSFGAAFSDQPFSGETSPQRAVRALALAACVSK